MILKNLEKMFKLVMLMWINVSFIRIIKNIFYIPYYKEEEFYTNLYKEKFDHNDVVQCNLRIYKEIHSFLSNIGRKNYSNLIICYTLEQSLGPEFDIKNLMPNYEISKLTFIFISILKSFVNCIVTLFVVFMSSKYFIILLINLTSK